MALEERQQRVVARAVGEQADVLPRIGEVDG
jgi:hypothetical protein